MKLGLAMIGVLLISACDGGTVGGSGVDGVTSSIADPNSLNGVGATGAGAFVLTSNDVNAGGLDVSLSFDNSNGVELSIFGGPPIHLTWNDTQNAYVSADGFYKITPYRDPSMPDVVVYKMAFADAAEAYDITGYFASGNLTPGANLRTSGSATYSGNMEVTDELAQTAAGKINISVNFASAAVTGNASIDSGTTLGPASFAWTNGVLQRGSGFSNYRGTLSSSDVTVTDSEVFGDFMGDQGQFIGGYIYVNTADHSIAGVYVAK